MLTELVVGLCALIECFVILWGLSQLNKTIYDASEELEEKLDEKIAALLAQTGLGGEPINPIQAAIANMLQNAASNQNTPIIEVARSVEGQFTKKD